MLATYPAKLEPNSMILNEEMAQEILDRHESGMEIAAIAHIMGLSYNQVYRVVTGLTFKHLTGGVSRVRDINEDYIVEMIKKGYSTTAVANENGISATAVSKIFRRVTGETISDYRKKHPVRYGEEMPKLKNPASVAGDVADISDWDHYVSEDFDE